MNNYLSLAQLSYPRVCNRTKPFTAAEIDRLLSLLMKYTPENDHLEVDTEGEDPFDAPRDGFTAEFSLFKAQGWIQKAFGRGYRVPHLDLQMYARYTIHRMLIYSEL